MKNKTIILASGINGGINSSLVKNAEKYFEKYNYNILKVDFFRKRNGAIFSFLDYNNYLEKELKKYKNKNTELIFIGHSFSSLVFLNFILSQEIKNSYKIILWDPSLAEELNIWIKKEFVLRKDKQDFYSKKEKISLNKDLVLELKKINSKNKFSEINKEICIIVADKGAVKNGKYLNKIFKYSKLETIKDADHVFSSKKSKKLLFEKTKNFIDN